MPVNNVKRIHEFGQSIWLDFIDRKIMNTGELQKLIAGDGVRGITSNPAIFGKAIASSSDYDEDIKKSLSTESDNEQLFYALAVKDIQRAADLFKPVYEDKVEGADGYVSLEVSPHFANDTGKTIEQALQLWKAIGRKNVMIKIPGTQAGLPAIRHCISEGLNVNVTLLFSLQQYEAVTEAYISGLEDRVQAGLPIGGIASVASFFLSRIDIAIDPLLKEKGLSDFVGEVAIASAKKAYEDYQRLFQSERFRVLEGQGAKPQKLLWASTASKDPAFSDVKYMEALIGADTVNTVPMDTLIAYRDHGNPESRLAAGLERATAILQGLHDARIDLAAITAKLQSEGIDKFSEPYEKLLATIDEQRHALKREINT